MREEARHFTSWVLSGHSSVVTYLSATSTRVLEGRVSVTSEGSGDVNDGERPSDFLFLFCLLGIA